MLQGHGEDSKGGEKQMETKCGVNSSPPMEEAGGLLVLANDPEEAGGGAHNPTPLLFKSTSCSLHGKMVNL